MGRDLKEGVQESKEAKRLWCNRSVGAGSHGKDLGFDSDRSWQRSEQRSDRSCGMPAAELRIDHGAQRSRLVGGDSGHTPGQRRCVLDQGSGGGGGQSLEAPTERAVDYGMAGKEEETGRGARQSTWAIEPR